MKQKLSTSILIIIALMIVLMALTHGFVEDISIFHAFILHPVFLLAGFSLLASVVERQSRK